MTTELKLTKVAHEGNLAEVDRILLGVRKIPKLVWLYLGSTFEKYVTANNNEALRKAVESNREAVVRRLLQVPEIAAKATANRNEALQVARRNNFIEVVNILLEIEAVRDLDLGIRKPWDVGLEINTHSASLHASASASAKRLYNKYANLTYQESMSDMSKYFSKNMKELRNLIKHLKKEDTMPSNYYIRMSIRAAIAYVKKETRRDDVSNLTLSKIFQLLLIGINQIQNAETKKDAYLQLCASLYLLKNEYGTSQSCPPGFFNGLIYSQQTTLPNEVSMVVQTKELATEALKNKITRFAECILKTNNYTEVQQFATAVSEQAEEQEIGSALMREILNEFYTVFQYESAERASEATIEELEVHCMGFYGCGLKKMFTELPPEYDKLYRAANASKIKKSTVSLSLS